jgi:AcrR family transcriptional regulator
MYHVYASKRFDRGTDESAMKNPAMRRNASQARSRATVEKILASAAQLISERGADTVTMTEIAQGAGVVIGTLYQYFSDKSEIMRALLAQHNEEVDGMLLAALEGVTTLEQLLDAMRDSYERYFAYHQVDPLFRSIWSAVQTDAGLQAMDAEDTLKKAAMLRDVAYPLYRDVDDEALTATCALILHLALSAARFALALPEPLRGRSRGVYQRMSREALASLERAR